MMRSALVIVFIFVLTVATPLDALEGGGRYPVMIVYDVSGSMGQYVDGRVPSGRGQQLPIKQALAVKTAETLFEQLRPHATGLSVGLTLFGHRKFRDCTDIEVVRRATPLSDEAATARLLGIIQKAEPTGSTPLMDSIRAAIRSIEASSQALTVVVITDGEDECGMPPCETIDAIKGEASKLIVHLIGLQSNNRQFEAVRCIADRTGGLAFRIMDPKDIGAAVTQLVGRLGSQAAASQPVPLGVLAARAWIDFGPDKPFPTDNPAPSLQIYRLGGAPLEGTETINGQVEHPLPPGDYEVQVRLGSFDKKYPVKVYGLQVTRFDLPILPGRIVAHLVDSQGALIEDEAEWTLAWRGNGTQSNITPFTLTARELRVSVAPGAYTITARLAERRSWQETTVEAEHELDVRLPWP
jgi:hypothetical protein